MAIMVPELTDVALATVPSSAEATFYKACREQLDDRFLVLHSLAMITSTRFGRRRDVEADFVIFNADAGFVAVEVKGGGVAYDPRTGWSSTDAAGIKHSIKDPFRQAMSEKYAVLSQIKQHPAGQNLKRIVIGHAVFFADIDRRAIVGSSESPTEIIGSRQDLSALRKWILAVLAYWSGTDSESQALGTDGMALIEEIFCKPIEAMPLTSIELERQESIRIKLTEQQSRLLRSLGRRKRAAICGGAGTGKTVLALKRAQELSAAGCRTLLLCYNRALSDHLKCLSDGNSLLLPMTFHQLCDWLIGLVRNQNGRDLIKESQKAYPGEDLFDVQMPFALALATEHTDERFDAIVIDEGQDFRDEFWLPIQLLMKDAKDTSLYVFFDQNQALYQKSKNFPVEDEPFVLSVNCRNARPIHNAAYQYFDGDLTEAGIEGKPVMRLVSSALPDQARLIVETVQRLCAVEKVHPAEVAVLIAGQPKNSFYTLLANQKITSGVEWSFEVHRKRGTVLVDTVARFKGLEAGIVFLWGIDELSAAREREILYVGISRAKSILHLVGTAAGVASITDVQRPATAGF